MISLETFLTILRPFYRQLIRAYDLEARNRRPYWIASTPFMDGWEIVLDGFWPLNWNAHLVTGYGLVVPASEVSRVWNNSGKSMSATDYYLWVMT